MEGGYFRETYSSDQSLKPGSRFEQRICTAIYFLLTEDTFSALHRLKEDEIYHFYLGDPVELFEISTDGSLTRTVLGPAILEGQQVQHLVKRNRWQGGRLQAEGKWALLGTTMAPGFVWENFELGNGTDLLSEYPQHKTIIKELIREQD